MIGESFLQKLAQDLENASLAAAGIMFAVFSVGRPAGRPYNFMTPDTGRSFF